MTTAIREDTKSTEATTPAAAMSAAAPAPRRSLPIALTGLAFGWLADWFFYGQRTGLAWPIFILLLTGSLAQAFWRERGQGPRYRWLLAPLLYFAVMVAVRSDGFLTFLNLGASLGLLLLVFHFAGAGELSRLGLPGFGLIPLFVVFQGARVGPPLLVGVVRQASMPRRLRDQLGALLRGLLLALPVLLVFGLLLVAADALFAGWLGRLLDWLNLASLLELSWRALWLLITGSLTAGGLVYALRRREGQAVDEVLRPAFPWTFLGFVEAAVVLFLVDLLFLGFVMVQFVYLFGGPANIGPTGFTYAEYARRGFFEILTVSCLSLGLILGLHWICRRETKPQLGAFNALSTLMIGLVLVMLVAAFYRLLLYEVSYGFTYLRLISHIFMVCLGLALLWTIAVLWWWPDRFAPGAVAAALIFVALLNGVNPDAFIVRQNVARVQTGQTASLPGLMGRLVPAAVRQAAADDLDAAYLARLADDAVPALVDLWPRLPDDARAQLEEELLRRWLRYEDDDVSWQAWHLGRFRAQRALSRLFAGEPG